MSIKRLLSIILLYITAMSLFSANNKPDFAFPATVSQNAEKDLEKAISQHDSHAAMNALIRYNISQSMIDPASYPIIIKKTEEVSEMFAKDKLHGLYLALLSKIYYDLYNSDKWKFDQRELPLSPLPDNIMEWSGEQFKSKICSLAIESVTGKNLKGLSDCPISKYSDLITYKYPADLYFPTLLDFAFLNAYDLTKNCLSAEKESEILEKALANSNKGSAPYIYWSVKAIYSPESPLEEAKLIKLMKQNSGNEFAGYIFTLLQNLSYNSPHTEEEDVEYSSESSMPNNGMDKEMQQKSEVLKLATEYINRFPSTPFIKEINDLVNKLSQPIVKVRTPNLCAIDSPFDVKIESTNAHDLTIQVYKIYDRELYKYNLKAETLISSRKPVVTRSITFDGILPFKSDSVVSLSVPEPGNYVIVPVFPGGNYDYHEYSIIRCIPVFPIAISNIDSPVVAVVDPVTGAPLPGVKVGLKHNNSSTIENVGITDSKGLAKTNGVDEQNQLSVTYQDRNYDFPYVSVQPFSYHVDTAAIYRASVLTDRSVYHPGEKLQTLSVLSKSYNHLGHSAEQSVCANQKIKITLLDANFTEVTSIEGITDDYGRVKAEFELPAEGLTGTFTIQVSIHNQKSSRQRDRVVGSCRVMVSDYKLPDFEITECVATNDTPEKGDVTITAKATTYSGMPVAGAKAAIILFGKSWIWWRQNSSMVFHSDDIKTGEDGRLSFVIPGSVFSAHDEYKFFNANIEIESATGSKSSTDFIFSIGKKYLISVDCPDIVDGNLPFAPTIEVRASDGSSIDTPLSWSLKGKDGKLITEGEFSGKIDLKDVVPGEYKFIVSPVDGTLADSSENIIVIFNTSTDVVPAESGIWISKSKYSTHNGKCEILYGTPLADTWVYCAISDGIGKMSDITLTKHGKGYHNFPVTIPQGQDRVYVNIFCVNNCGVSSQEIIVERKKEDKSLKIVGETFRDKLIPGSQETWKIRITGADGQSTESALMLDMYNKALDALWSHDMSITAYISNSFSPLIIDHIPTGSFIYSVSGKLLPNGKTLVLPCFNFYGQHLPFITNNYIIRGYGTMRKSAASPRMMMETASAATMGYYDMDDAVEEESMEADAGDDEMPAPDSSDEVPQDDNFDYRSDYEPLAVWAPILTTDKDGNISYTFTVPNATTTWRMIALAWTKNFEQGKLVRDFVASKPLMVQPNLPRFLRNGDRAVILASVMNNSDETISAATAVELFNPVTGTILDKKEFTQEIAPGAAATISSDIVANYNLDAIGYRIRTSNGDFSDGEQSVIRILPSEASLIETLPFYLNSGDTEFITQLPKEKGARISLTFMENPTWTILTALPGLRTQIEDYANSAAAALYSAGIARGLIKDNPKLADAIKHWSENPNDSTLISSLQKNEDLKIALLNATPWVQAAQSETERMASLAMLLDNSQVEASINKALDILSYLQQKDGGWKWGKWCDESSVWVTSNVLSMMADLKSLGWMPNDTRISSMLKKALNFYDGKVKDTDLIYTIVRPQFTETPISSNGKQVINSTIKEISTDWKKYNDVAYKAMAAEALFRNKEQILASEILRSISEFGVMTKDQGLKFPSVNALYNYAILLKTFALIKPNSPEVDGLRQQLIVRKQGSDWGSAIVTTEVVQSILCSGSNWTVDARGAKISAGNNKIEPTSPIEEITGWLRADLSQYTGKNLSVETSGTGPSYGAVYAQFDREMADVKASSCNDLDIEKQIFVRRGSAWEGAKSLSVGDRVKVQLTIHCKRNLNYVSIIDQRPACYEPVDQLPGWLWSEGVGFYRENRDSQTQLHVVYMRPGTYLLTYEVNVNNAGEFSSGVATIQSQYAPEISAHSSGSTLSVHSK